MNSFRIVLPLFAATLGATSNLSAQAILSGSDLELQIGSNGAVQEATLGEVGFWAQGFRNWPVADFNVAVEGQLYYAGATGADMAGLSQDGDAARFEGALGSKLGVVRSYSLVEGAPVMRVEIEFANLSAETLEFTGREIFDADPGNTLGTSSLTHNDLASLDGRLVAESWAAGESDYAVVTGFATESAAQFSTFVRGGDDAFEDGFVAANLASRDSDGLYAEETISLNYALSLLPGESFKVVYLQAFGSSLADAEANFLSALGAGASPVEAVQFEREVLIAPVVMMPAAEETSQDVAIVELPPMTVSRESSLRLAMQSLAL